MIIGVRRTLLCTAEDIQKPEPPHKTAPAIQTSHGHYITPGCELSKTCRV